VSEWKLGAVLATVAEAVSDPVMTICGDRRSRGIIYRRLLGAKFADVLPCDGYAAPSAEELGRTPDDLSSLFAIGTGIHRRRSGPSARQRQGRLVVGENHCDAVGRGKMGSR
jgi:hypothetical protein